VRARARRVKPCGQGAEPGLGAFTGGMSEIYDVVIIGAGAAGIGAGRRLAKAQVSFLLIDARDRIGGRALTRVRDGLPFDVGCGWLHSGDRNVLTALAESTGFTVDRTPAPWGRQAGNHGMSGAEQAAFAKAFEGFEARIDELGEHAPPAPASAYLDPGCRWNALLGAVFSYINGVSLDCFDAADYARYEDTGCNWRVMEGYGAVIAALGAALPVALGAYATTIDHSGASVRVETTRGAIAARTLIVTIPTSQYAALDFRPALPTKVEAAAVLPMGAAEKAHFLLRDAEEFPADSHLFAHIDRPDTGSYYLRPFGRPMIEVFFGGALARGLAQAGAGALADYAKQELADLLGSAFPARLTTLSASTWSCDPLSDGAYSYACVGAADARAALAAPVNGRLLFAGEACSRARYGTAHGAFETGYFAAEAALAQLPSPRA
jgi:monoamine oxidase